MTRKTKIEIPGSIGLYAGAVYPVLPGESEEEYSRGLEATIEELQAHTPLQIYLAEKIFDCLWWVRRFETQKRSLLIGKMVQLLQADEGFTGSGLMWEDINLSRMLQSGDWGNAELQHLMEHYEYTSHGLVSRAMLECNVAVKSIDENIAMRVKTMSGFQAAYENLKSRRFHIERLQLQNDLLRRDLAAIDVPEVIGNKATGVNQIGAEDLI